MSNPAETYESYMVPPLFAPFAQRLVAAADPRPGERVLDIACGTGIVARLAAPYVGSTGALVGIDLNPDMLAVARAAAGRAGLSIDWHEGRAEALSIPDGSFDVALCQFGLMFFADRQAALADMHRVLTPGGRAAVSVWQGLDHHPFYQTLHEVIERLLGSSSVDDIFALGDADELRRSLTQAGFRDVAIYSVSLSARFPDPEGFLAGEIDVDTAAIPAMQHLDATARKEMTATIRDEMAGPLGAVTEGDQVVIPFHAHIARGYR
jgi:ubiquinone/menaquinone biosynthesis C-methylase UbiE